MPLARVTVMTGNPDLRVTLRDHHVPQTTSGTYHAHVEHLLVDEQGGAVDQTDPLPDVQQRYEVQAVQFVLDSRFVHSSYPAPGAVGRFTHTLAHVTLNRDILPWERQLRGTRTAERAPWLALLVFAEHDLPEDPAATGTTVPRAVADLLSPTDGVYGPDIDPGRLSEDTLRTVCQTVDVPADVFASVVPREAELHDLTHTREVAKAPARADGEVLTEGQFAVVLANRFPRSAGSYAAHLVSLEGFEGRLNPGDVSKEARVRLCSLHSWSFTCDLEGTTDIEGLLRTIAAPSLTDPENLALRLSTDSTNEAGDTSASRRLRLGYVPVTHRPATGELTFAWYRGPFTPVTAPALPLDLEPGPHPSADHRLIYEEEHGVFDVSYASAWTLGRAIGLADPGFAADSVRARRELVNRAARIAALSLDPQRRAHGTELHDGPRVFDELAQGFGPTLLRSLAAPLAEAPVPPRAATPRVDRQALRGVLAGPRYRDLLRDTAENHTGAMPDWLHRLSLLHGVPFSFLVPDPRMLPAESLRLFRIDPSWITALLDGARDATATTSADTLLDTVMRDALAARGALSGPPTAGMLINSTLVRSWPDLDITATAAGNPRPLNVLRRDQLGPSILLVLYDAVPDELAIRESGQGIHFGISGEARVNLRQLKSGDHPELGAQLQQGFPTGPTTVFTDHLRPSSDAQRRPDVLNLRQEPDPLVPALAAALDCFDLGPAQLAVQLINAPLQQRLGATTARDRRSMS